MNNYNELRKQVRDAFVDDEKSGMFPTVDWVMNYLIAQGRIVPDGYAAVPLEPTVEMGNIGACHITRTDHTNDRYYSAKAVYKAMIAAAPKGEV